jgi:heme/copper-type cytochrome/quinol oxidase subunit 3
VLKVTFCSSPGPAEMLVAHAALYTGESSATLMLLAVTVKLGASFTAAYRVDSKV